MTTQGHNSLSTLGHRWPVWRKRWANKVLYWAREWTTSDEIGANHALITGAQHGEVPTVAKHADALVELVAWYWTEGSLGTSGRRVSIAQSHTVNAERVDRIRTALTAVYGSGWAERIQPNDNSHGGPVTVFSLNGEQSAPLLGAAPGRGKTVRMDFVRELTAAQLELFIDVSCQGDGWHYRQGITDIWQKNRAGLAAFELALILSGRAVSEHRSGDGGWVSPD